MPGLSYWSRALAALGAILRDSGAGRRSWRAGCQPADLADPDPFIVATWYALIRDRGRWR